MAGLFEARPKDFICWGLPLRLSFFLERSTGSDEGREFSGGKFLLYCSV